MIRRTLGLLAGVLLFGPVSCLDEVGPDSFTTKNTCVPGESARCDCPSGEQGIRTCSREGVFDECLCPGCTIYPDCNECDPDDCFHNCMCWAGRPDPLVCRSTCEDLGNDAGSSCDVSACPPPAAGTSEMLMAEACCTSDGQCGLSFGGLSVVGACFEPNQAGDLDAACQKVTLGGVTLKGCCRPDGVCGGLETVLGLGCVDANSVNGDPEVQCGQPR